LSTYFTKKIEKFAKMEKDAEPGGRDRKKQKEKGAANI